MLGNGLGAEADSHEQLRPDNVHPPEWVNPAPAPRYNLVVIGAGPAGLSTAAGAAGQGATIVTRPAGEMISEPTLAW